MRYFMTDNVDESKDARMKVTNLRISPANAVRAKPLLT